MDGALREAMRRQTYLMQSRALGVSEEVANAELAAVRADVYNPERAVPQVDVYAVAFARLCSGGPRFQPSDRIRAALRRAYPNADPASIDAFARQVAPGETLASEWGLTR